MYRVPEDVWTTGDLVTLRELLRELAVISSELNGGTDADNIGASQITEAKLDLDAVHAIFNEQAEGAAVYSQTSSREPWSEWLPVTDLVNDVDTTDAPVKLEFSASWEWDSATSDAAVQVGIRVDGDLKAMSGPEHLQFTPINGHKAVAVVSLGAGTHRIEPVIRFSAGLWSGASTVSVTLYDRRITAWELRR